MHFVRLVNRSLPLLTLLISFSLSSHIDLILIDDGFHISGEITLQDGVLWEIVVDSAVVYSGRGSAIPFHREISFPKTGRPTLHIYSGGVRESIDIPFEHLWLPEPSLILTEWAPRATSEWVEIFNSSTLPISTSGWGVVAGEREHLFPEIILQPQTYTLFCRAEVHPFLEHVTMPRKMTMNIYRDSLRFFSPLGDISFYSWDYDTLPLWRERESLVPDGVGGVRLVSPTPGGPTSPKDISDDIEFSFRTKVCHWPDPMILDVVVPYGYRYSVEIFSLEGDLLFRDVGSKSSTYSWDGRDRSGRVALRGPVIAVFSADSGRRKRAEAVLWY